MIFYFRVFAFFMFRVLFPKRLTFMWGGRESMTCKITSYHHDEDEEVDEEDEKVEEEDR